MDHAKMTLLAPAKINLYLGVTSLRPDGYHDVETVMQSVGLFDRVTVETFYSDAPLVSVDCPELSGLAPEKNTAYKAAEQYLRATENVRTGVKIKIEKHIPDGAGLGGGSSDAAAVLTALNLLDGGKLDAESLCAIGAKVGADVPFFVKNGTVKATGIGEITEALPPLPDCFILIAMPHGVKVSTEAAYSSIGNGYPSELEKMISAVNERDLHLIAASMKNDFEKTVDGFGPSMSLKNKMISLGALGALMSGSGAAVFGIFEDRADASRAGDALADAADTFVCVPVGKNYTYVQRDGRKKKTIKVIQPQSSCESCEFFVYDEELDDYVCDISLDEDEMADYMGRHTGSCPYYRFYDEYKSVQKQN